VKAIEQRLGVGIVLDLIFTRDEALRVRNSRNRKGVGGTIRTQQQHLAMAGLDDAHAAQDEKARMKSSLSSASFCTMRRSCSASINKRCRPRARETRTRAGVPRRCSSRR